MPRNCRTCEAVSEMLICAHEWRCGDVCEEHKPRETPLLVDQLAEALRAVQDEDRLVEFVDVGLCFPREPLQLFLQRVFPEMALALARYQEEIG